MGMADPDFTGKRAVTKLTILLAARLGVEIDQGDVEGMIRKDWEKLSCLAHSAHAARWPRARLEVARRASALAARYVRVRRCCDL